MRTAKPPLLISLAAIGIAMLLYSPLCSLSCALNSCAFSRAVSPAPDERSGHCHARLPGHASSAPTPQGPPAPPPPTDSGNCPAHVDGVAALPSMLNANAGLQQNLQPEAAEPAIMAGLSFDLRGVMRADGTALRSPPARPINSVLRI